MITEEAYSPYFFKIKLDGKLTYEMKGTWELRNDFMSGPFINYAILDEENDRVLFWKASAILQRKTRFNAPIGIHYKISFRT
jgi:hypothetical protein